jgi:hypothetical protein
MLDAFLLKIVQTWITITACIIDKPGTCLIISWHNQRNINAGRSIHNFLAIQNSVNIGHTRLPTLQKTLHALNLLFFVASAIQYVISVFL